MKEKIGRERGGEGSVIEGGELGTVLGLRTEMSMLCRSCVVASGWRDIFAGVV